eukprot:COSAG02_NODE_19149_length_897_cov_1.329574_1_plen_60_part_10
MAGGRRAGWAQRTNANGSFVPRGVEFRQHACLVCVCGEPTAWAVAVYALACGCCTDGWQS